MVAAEGDDGGGRERRSSIHEREATVEGLAEATIISVLLGRDQWQSGRTLSFKGDRRRLRTKREGQKQRVAMVGGGGGTTYGSVCFDCMLSDWVKFVKLHLQDL